MPAFDPLIHQPTRLAIMGLLYRNRSAAVVWVRDTLGLTDGNLASHAAKLVEAGYLEQRRAMVRRGFQARITITPAGDAAFQGYREALRELTAGEPPGGSQGAEAKHERNVFPPADAL